MATILTEADEFTADLPAPDGGDARNAASVRTIFQRLANRSRYLYNVLTALIATVAGGLAAAGYNVAGSALASSTKATLTQLLASSGFSIVSNAVEVPSAGRYLVFAHVQLTNPDTTDPTVISVTLRVGGVNVLAIGGVRYSATTSNAVFGNGITLIQVTTPSSSRIDIFNNTTDTNIITTVSQLVIVRIGN